MAKRDCPTCDGHGTTDPPDGAECPTCSGLGWVENYTESAAGEASYILEAARRVALEHGVDALTYWARGFVEAVDAFAVYRDGDRTIGAMRSPAADVVREVEAAIATVRRENSTVRLRRRRPRGR